MFHPKMKAETVKSSMWLVIKLLLCFLVLNLTNGLNCAPGGLTTVTVSFGGVDYYHSKCVTCNSGYYVLVGGTIATQNGSLYTTADCSPCYPNCKNCTDYTSCNKCLPNYYQTLDLTACNPCTIRHSNCITCDFSNCLTCMANYVVDTGACVVDCLSLYGANCTTCDVTECLACDTGFARNTSLFTKNCASCAPITNCQTCADGPACSLCNNRYFLNSSNRCEPCSVMTNCYNCSSGTLCTSCNGPTFLDYSNASQSCTNCWIPHCTQCTHGPICMVCDTNFFRDFSTTNSLCVTCSAISNCLSCADGPRCTQCAVNYITTAATSHGICIACASGQYSSGNLCHSCPSHCSYCQQIASGVLCSACQYGFILDPFAICVQCKSYMSKCITCSTLSTCTLCEYPYLVGPSGNCDQCAAGFEYFSSLCVNPPGCCSFLPDYSKCFACFAEYNFVYVSSNSTCACDVGFSTIKINNVTNCVSQCGDGILVSKYEDCDDGNQRNNDGCTSLCKIENDFTCSSDSPTQCTLHYTPTNLEYNYVYRYQGVNRCKFSLSIYPEHNSFQYIDWSKYISFNVSDDAIVPNTKYYFYNKETGEISVQFDYRQNLQAQLVQFVLSFNGSSSFGARLLFELEFKSVLVSALSSSGPTVFSSAYLSTVVEIQGINRNLIYEDSSILQAYQGAGIISFAITILVLLQLVIATYFHKMIGLETIQILQFFYFVRIIVDQRQSSLLSSMNVFKYTAYGGYSNYDIIYGGESEGAESLTLMTVNKNFIMVGLMKFFSLNTNLSLAIPLVALLVYALTLARKYYKRNSYLKTHCLAEKDQYTELHRRSQWVYDHFVFPYINVFNMLVFFSTILYLQSLSSPSKTNLKQSDTITFIEKTSFFPHLIMFFLTLSIYCFEVFRSYQEYQHSKLTEKQKTRVPTSMIEKLEHDENNPDRANYKPGYVFFYLMFYFAIEIVLMLDVLIESLKGFSVQILLCLNFLYLIFVWLWKPYHSAVEFHNKVLRFNHLTVFLFMVICEVFSRFTMSPALYVALVYIILLCLAILTVCGFLRIFVEYKFRKKLLEDHTLLDHQNDQPNKKSTNDAQIQRLNKKQMLLRRNPFTFENQIKPFIEGQNHPEKSSLTDEQINNAKKKLRRQIYLDQSLIKSLKDQDYVPKELFFYHNDFYLKEHQNKNQGKILNPLRNLNDRQKKFKQQDTTEENQLHSGLLKS